MSISTVNMKHDRKSPASGNDNIVFSSSVLCFNPRLFPGSCASVQLSNQAKNDFPLGRRFLRDTLKLAHNAVCPVKFSTTEHLHQVNFQQLSISHLASYTKANRLKT